MHVLPARERGNKMKPKQTRIQSDGSTQGTLIETYDGHKIICQSMTITADAGFPLVKVTLNQLGPELDIVADCTNIESLAMDLHEAGKAAVEAGNTVAAEKFGEQTRKFLEWDEITETARDGRRQQAGWLLSKYAIIAIAEHA